MDAANNRHRHRHRSDQVSTRFTSRAPLMVLFLLMVERSDAFHANVFRGNYKRSARGFVNPEPSISGSFSTNAHFGHSSYRLLRNTYCDTTTMLAMTGGNNGDSDQAALQSMLDQAVMISSKHGKGAAPELEALIGDMKAALEAPIPASTTPTGTRSKAEVAKLLDEALSTYMDSMMTGSPTVEEDKARMEALALEVGQIDDAAAAAESDATTVRASIPLTSFQERLDAIMEKLSAQPAAPVKKETVAAPPSPSPGEASDTSGTKQLLDAAFGRMQPKERPPKPEKDGNTGVPSLAQKPPKPVESKENAELDSKTVVPISNDPPAMVVKKKKETESKPVTTISNDPHVISGKDNHALEAKTVVPISSDPPMISRRKGNSDLEANTVVPISKESPASFSQQGKKADKKGSGDVKVALSKPELVPESERSVKPRKESAPAPEIVAQQSSSKADDRNVVEEQPHVESLPAKEKTTSEPVLVKSTGSKATKGKAKKPAPAESLPPIVFPPGDLPDANDLRRLLDEATVWFVAHGNDVDPTLRKEVEEMIEEMDHILYFATTKNSGRTSTPQRAVLMPDSHSNQSESPSPKKEQSDSLVVSGALALDFFQERLASLPGYERSKEEEIVSKEVPNVIQEESEGEAKARAIAAAYKPKAKAISESYVSKPVKEKSAEPAQSKVVQSNPAGLTAVDAAFKTLASGPATSGDPRTIRGSTPLGSDSTYVSLN